jgi:hypothetical protein
MKSVVLVLGTVLCFVGCADTSEKQVSQEKPRFGQPESTIPWNQPQQWEQAGQLGSMPGFSGQGGGGRPGSY